MGGREGVWAGADFVWSKNALVVWINHSIPEWLIAETTRILRIVVLSFRSQENLVIETNH